jgi:hypothetical protein
MRQILVHYHMFKNAGSTFDSMLEKSFGPRWTNHDKGQAAAYISPDELRAFIEAHPKLLAVSSHHAVLPVPDVPGVEVTPVLFLRHPLDRVRSVYDFERRQGLESGPVSKGAEHAARLPLADYLRWRLDSTANGVVHNFQTVRMIFNPRYNRHPIKDDEFAVAWSRVKALPFFGLVEEFDAGILLLSRLLRDRGMVFATDYVPRNQSAREGSLQERLDRMRTEVGDAMWQELVARNQRDLALYELACDEFRARSRLVQH